MASDENPNRSPNPRHHDDENNISSNNKTSPSSPRLPPRKRRLSPSPSRSDSRSRSRSDSRSRSRSPIDDVRGGKRRRQNDLSVDVCRDFVRSICRRSEIDCKYAHPHSGVAIEKDKVMACADSLRNLCFRGRTCRYYHPPPHIQEVLLKASGIENPKVKPICRDFVRGRCPRSASECRFSHHSSVENSAVVCQDFMRGRCERKSCRYSHITSHAMSRMRDGPMHYTSMVYMPPPIAVPVMLPPRSPPRSSKDKETMQVCRDFLKKMCKRESCKYAHPNSENKVIDDMVEICRDFERGDCKRSACRYYHAPARLNAVE